MSTQVKSPIKLDTLRIDTYVFDLEARLDQVKAFVVEKKRKLINAEDKLEQFLTSIKGSNLTIANMYSTGIGKDEYNSTCDMIAHGSFILDKEYKNTKLAEVRLQDKWAEIFKGEISAIFNYYKIEGTTVNFKIWI